jgi:WD40 repeat protein
LFDSSSVAISPGLNLIASHYENTITIWDVQTGKLLHTFESKLNGEFNNIHFSSYFPILMVFDEYNFSNCEAWNPIDGKLIGENIDKDTEYGQRGEAISSDGLLLIRNRQISNLLSGEIISDFNTNDSRLFADNELQSIDNNEFHLVDTEIYNIDGVDLFDYPSSSSFSKMVKLSYLLEVQVLL